jgi:hypothetical protein
MHRTIIKPEAIHTLGNGFNVLNMIGTASSWLKKIYGYKKSINVYSSVLKREYAYSVRTVTLNGAVCLV